MPFRLPQCISFSLDITLLYVTTLLVGSLSTTNLDGSTHSGSLSNLTLLHITSLRHGQRRQDGRIHVLIIQLLDDVENTSRRPDALGVLSNGVARGLIDEREAITQSALPLPGVAGTLDVVVPREEAALADCQGGTRDGELDVVLAVVGELADELFGLIAVRGAAESSVVALVVGSHDDGAVVDDVDGLAVVDELKGSHCEEVVSRKICD